MKRSRWLVFCALVSALALVAAACGGGDEEGGDGTAGGGTDCTWVIGTMGALSGDFASIGQPIFQGIEYAVNELNDKGELPCKLKIHSEDSQGSGDQAPPLAQALVDDEELIAIVGPYFSGETLAVGTLFSDSNIPFVTPSATNDTIDDQGFSTFFRAVPDDELQAQVAADYIVNGLGGKKVAIVHDNSDYGKPLAENVGEGLSGAEASEPFVINPEETDYSSVVQQINSFAPDVIFYGGYSPQAGPLVKQLSEAGVDAQFLSDDGTKDSAFGDLAGAAAEGVQVTCPCADPLQIPESKAFVDGINADYDRNPGTFAADAYDAVNMVAETVKDLNGDEDVTDIRQTVIDGLRGLDAYEGITKTYTFLDTGNLDIGPEGIWVYEWSDKDGDFIALGKESELI